MLPQKDNIYHHFSSIIFDSTIGLVSCSSIIAGDWRDDGVVVKTSASSNSTNAIDPNACIDASGKP